MLVVNERIPLRQVVEQGWNQLREQVLEQLKKTIEGLLLAERDRQIAERKQRGETVYRWGYTVRKGWSRLAGLWGELQQVRAKRHIDVVSGCGASKRSGCWRSISGTAWRRCCWRWRWAG